VAAKDILPAEGEWFDETLAQASPDMLREMVVRMAQMMMDAEVEQRCGAGYGEVSGRRTNSRNGYRRREWDTRAGTVELAIPKLRTGSYYPEWLLERQRRAERALASVVATSYLLGVWTRRVEKLAEQLGVTKLSKSQVSVMARELDEMVADFRDRPLDAGPYTFVWIDALTQKVREGGRTVNVHALVATGVNAGGHREILGIDVVSSEDGAGWLAFLRGLVARGLSGVSLVVSDCHAGLRDAIASTLPGASWQRCRAHWTRTETRCRFRRGRSLIRHGDQGGGAAATCRAFRRVAAASERAAAAADAGDGGGTARPWRRPRRRAGCGSERDHRPPGPARAGHRLCASGRGTCPQAGRWPQASDGA
jgi:transposase-like protein